VGRGRAGTGLGRDRGRCSALVLFWATVVGPRLIAGSKNDTVKLTITLHVALKADLDRYAELHTQAWGQPIDVAALIPFILDNCITRDRGFRKAKRGPPRKLDRPAPAILLTFGLDTRRSTVG